LDYGEDFTTNADAVEVIQTTYQVGKGLLAHVQEMARQEEVLQAKADVDDVEPQADEELEEQASIEEPAFAVDVDAAADAEAVDEDVVVTRDENFEADVVFASKKRMRFVIGAEI
jgi:hypothetical protein